MGQKFTIMGPANAPFTVPVDDAEMDMDGVPHVEDYPGSSFYLPIWAQEDEGKWRIMLVSAQPLRKMRQDIGQHSNVLEQLQTKVQQLQARLTALQAQVDALTPPVTPPAATPPDVTGKK